MAHKIISFLYALFLPLHMLNSMTLGESLKLWYLPVMVMAVVGMFQCKRCWPYKQYRRYAMLVVLTFLTCIIGGTLVVGDCVNFLIIFLSLIPLLGMDKRLIYQLTPFFLFVAIELSFMFATWINTNYRFQGLYNDPNYLCVSLVVGIYMCCQNFKNNGWIVKMASVLAILFSIYTVLVTQSRGGMVALFCVLFFVLISYYSTNRKIVLTILLIGFLSSSSLMVKYAQNIDNIVMRFSGERESDVSSANSRIQEIESSFHAIADFPPVLLFGAGYGISGKALEERMNLPYLFDNYHRIHNTYMAVFFEQGVVSFFLFLGMVLTLVLRTWKNDKVKFAVLVAILLQAATIWLMPYLPFWMIFTVCAEEDKEMPKITLVRRK